MPFMSFFGSRPSNNSSGERCIVLYCGTVLGCSTTDQVMSVEHRVTSLPASWPLNLPRTVNRSHGRAAVENTLLTSLSTCCLADKAYWVIIQLVSSPAKTGNISCKDTGCLSVRFRICCQICDQKYRFVSYRSVPRGRYLVAIKSCCVRAQDVGQLWCHAVAFNMYANSGCFIFR